LTSKVAAVEFDGNETESFKQALHLIGGIDDLNTAIRDVVIKVGVFSHRADNHTSVSVVDSIVNSFDKAPRILLAESDNYRGAGLERLQIWKELFCERIVPFNLSDESNARNVKIVGEEMNLSSVLFKPNVLVDTHILRSFERGSILKNLFGCIPTSKKMKYHKVLPKLLADVYETVGGIDLAVLDGTHFWSDAGDSPVRLNILLVGRDAVAVETVGAAIAGLKPEKMPVIQEFVNRGLGEGTLKNIEIAGTSLENIKKKLACATKTQKKSRLKRAGPQTWGGQAHHALENLISEGFFRLPNKKTVDDVAKALEAKGLSTNIMKTKITDSLTRRVKKGVLKKAKNQGGWVYWTE
jgi:uncharacterized protein (DUF362 family)